MSTALIFTAKLLIFIAVLIFIAQAYSTRKSLGMRLSVHCRCAGVGVGVGVCGCVCMWWVGGWSVCVCVCVRAYWQWKMAALIGSCNDRDANFQKLKSVRWAMWWYNSHLLEPGNEATHTHARTHTQPHPPLLHSKDTPTSTTQQGHAHFYCKARILGMRLRTCTHIHAQPHPPLLHSKDTPTSNRTERIPGMRLHTHTLGMGWYRYQIFDIVNTGLRSDGIDICKHYQHVSIHARAALCMC